MINMQNLLSEISTCMEKIAAQQAADIEAVLQQGVCPRCGVRVAAARHQGFIEGGQGLTERLVARCAAGHEWAARDPGFRWEGQG